jgi:hypothetical protein
MTNDALGSALERLEGAIRDSRLPEPAVAAERAPEHLAAMMAREASARRAVDGMCRDWAADGELPASLDQVTRNLFYARLVEARSLGLWLRENGFGAPDVPVEALLELLLVGYWRSFAAASWRSSAEGRLHP